MYDIVVYGDGRTYDLSSRTAGSQLSPGSSGMCGFRSSSPYPVACACVCAGIRPDVSELGIGLAVAVFLPMLSMYLWNEASGIARGGLEVTGVPTTGVPRRLASWLLGFGGGTGGGGVGLYITYVSALPRGELILLMLDDVAVKSELYIG